MPKEFQWPAIYDPALFRRFAIVPVDPDLEAAKNADECGVIVNPLYPKTFFLEQAAETSGSVSESVDRGTKIPPVCAPHP